MAAAYLLKRCLQRTPHARRRRHALAALTGLALAVLAVLAACTSAPELPPEIDTRPLASLPITLRGIEDDRARFRHTFCEVNRQAGDALPDSRPCDAALPPYLDESTAPEGLLERGNTLWIAHIVVVPGPSWACNRDAVGEQALLQHVRDFGYQVSVAPAEGLASTQRNARLIHDHVFDEERVPSYSPIVLLGFSKGVPDILEALTLYPELSERVLAVISIAGAIGGSPLADNYFRRSLAVHEQAPGGDCIKSGVDLSHSFKTSVRRHWLATHPLPASIRYYSIVSLPRPEQIGSALEADYRRLSRIDRRNDGQLLYYDQILPNSTLLGFVNADHLSVSTPRPFAGGSTSPDQAIADAYPREVLLESVLRYLEQDLARKRQRAAN